MMAAQGDAPLPLPAFLKLLSSPPSSLSMQQAMRAAGKLLPAGYNSLAKLRPLKSSDLSRLGIDDEDIRKGIIAFVKTSATPGLSAKAGKKRSRDSDLDRPLPTKPTKEVVQTDFDFQEVLFEEALAAKSVVVNRAPVMTAWATIVAERLGFKRQEALSIAQVYTDLNAAAKGVSLGLMTESSKKIEVGSSQPYVDLMGRQIPVISMQDGEWRGIARGAVAAPEQAFNYIHRNFRQQMGSVMGAMRLLGESFAPEELNKKGFGLYCEFRPNTEGWGKRSEMKVQAILDLRRHLTHTDGVTTTEADQKKTTTAAPIGNTEVDEKPSKRLKTEGEEDGLGLQDAARDEDEFDRALDDELDLSNLPY